MPRNTFNTTTSIPQRLRFPNIVQKASSLGQLEEALGRYCDALFKDAPQHSKDRPWDVVEDAPYLMQTQDLLRQTNIGRQLLDEAAAANHEVTLVRFPQDPSLNGLFLQEKNTSLLAYKGRPPAATATTYGHELRHRSQFAAIPELRNIWEPFALWVRNRVIEADAFTVGFTIAEDLHAKGHDLETAHYFGRAEVRAALTQSHRHRLFQKAKGLTRTQDRNRFFFLESLASDVPFLRFYDGPKDRTYKILDTLLTDDSCGWIIRHGMLQKEPLYRLMNTPIGQQLYGADDLSSFLDKAVPHLQKSFLNFCQQKIDAFADWLATNDTIPYPPAARPNRWAADLLEK
jgi:hypothetical protein